MSIQDKHLARRAFLGGGLAVTAVGALGVPAVAAPGQSAAGRAAGGRVKAPSIYTVEDWGARDPSGSIETLDQKPTQIIVHHTAGANSDDTSEEYAFQIAKSIQDFHMDDNGWTDTGQNFTTFRGGQTAEGRHGSLPALEGGSQHVVGAHAGDQNSVALGIENDGTYTDEDVPDALWTALVDLVTYMIDQYGIDTGEIYGHRDFMSTECPGEVLYGRLDELRESVAGKFGVKANHPLTWPLLKPGTKGPKVTAVQHLLRAQGKQVPVDGTFGAGTQRAADEFGQAKKFAQATCFGSPVAERGLFGGSAWTALAPELNSDSRGEAVRAAQILLTSRGHYVAADARATRRMTSVVRDFQTANKVNATGVVDHQTWKLLLR